MAITKTKKYQATDPAYYDPLIVKQKERVRQDPKAAKEWLELGMIHEAKIELTNCLAKSTFCIRHFLPIYVLLFSSAIAVLTPVISKIAFASWQFALACTVTIVVLILCQRVWSLRYPPSGARYFKKALALNPNCAEAYLHLGWIALRRYQKRKGCLLLEHAMRLGQNSSKAERELKSLYEKEFVTLFKDRTNREVRQQEIIDSQQEQIRKLCSVVASLKGRTDSLSARAEQAKWEASHKAKSVAKEMKDRITTLRREYEGRIANLRRTKESTEEAKELAEKDFVRLTTEIMEAKSALEGQSLAEAARTIEEIIGSGLWQALSEQTKSYLATAQQIFAILIERKEQPDYSLVGMELCKALETEINRTLVQSFVEYLNGNKEEFLKINQTCENKGKPCYFTHLARVVDRHHFPEVTSLTLGQYHFALKRTLEGEYALREYWDFLDETCSASGVDIGRTFLKNLETVTKRYRNTIAHESPMNKKECDHLRALILGGQGALLTTCCRIGMEHP